MKNIFSKTLVCGVIASSFILVNCQKSPTGRGVKGKIGAPQSPADKNVAEAAKDLMIKCSPEFMKEYTVWQVAIESTEVKNLKEIKSKDDLDKEQLADLADFAKQLEKKTGYVNSEIKKMQADRDKLSADKKQETKTLDGCFSEGKKREDYAFEAIRKSTNSVLARISSLTGIESAGSKQHELERAAHSDVTKKAEFYVSEKFNAALDEKNFEETFFQSGKIMTGEAERAKAIEDEKSSLCYVDKTAGKLDDLDKTLNAMNVLELNQIGTKAKQAVVMMSGDKNYIISCVMPAKKNLTTAFREAMGMLLQSKEQREKNKAKEKISADKVEEKVAEKKTAKAETTDKKAEDLAKKKLAIEKERLENARKATAQVLEKNKKSKTKLTADEEIEAVLKAEREAAEKEHELEEQENLKRMQADLEETAATK